jgi:HD-GYP domain-containing protein (c-di-GMP phosphodiesterase class II)
MNWNPDDLEYLEIAALLHDVGKVVIPETVLTKTEALSPDDWKTIQMHPSHGAQIVKNIEPLNKIAPWIYHHQERWDGSGYPQGLKGNEIPKLSQIISVVDAYDAITSERPYKAAMSQKEALAEIRRCSATQFAPDIAEVFLGLFESESAIRN